MGCGASSSAAVMDPEATAAMDSKESKTVPKDSTDAPADDRKNESDADRARRELQIGEELTPERKIAFSRSFTLPHSAQDVWVLISDWNAEYLVAYAPNVSVSVGAPPQYPSLLQRFVRLPSGVFEEILLNIDQEKLVVEYVFMKGPVPFQRQFVSFKLIPSGSNCQLLWSSFAWAKPIIEVKAAQISLEQGVVNAIEVVKQQLRTRRPEPKGVASVPPVATPSASSSAAAVAPSVPTTPSASAAATLR